MSDSDEKREFLLSSLRAGSMRAKLIETEINSIGVALKGGLIDCYMAMQWVKEIGAMELIRPVPIGENEEISTYLGLSLIHI